jgi:hypothetical protein
VNQMFVDDQTNICLLFGVCLLVDAPEVRG